MLFSTHLNAGNSHLISMHSASMIRILREFLLEANLQTARPQFVRNISFVFWKKRTFLQMSFFSFFLLLFFFRAQIDSREMCFPPVKERKKFDFWSGKMCSFFLSSKFFALFWLTAILLLQIFNPLSFSLSFPFFFSLDSNVFSRSIGKEEMFVTWLDISSSFTQPQWCLFSISRTFCHIHSYCIIPVYC